MVRAFHAIKGNSSFFEDAAMTPVARAAEDAVERLVEHGDECSTELRDLLQKAVARLRQLVDESAAQGEPVSGDRQDESLVLALDSILPFNTASRYLFWGQDVTDHVRTLTEVADREQVGAERRHVVQQAVLDLSQLARDADVHDVARAIEAALPANGGQVVAGQASTDSTGCYGFDPTSIRGALRALAPLLQRESKPA